MPSADTELGGTNRAFRTTMWSAILAARDPSDPTSRESLNRLVAAYWKPVYAFIRLVGKSGPEDAKDLTQTFFATFYEKGYWSNLEPGRGSFRAYLRTALRHFIISARRHDAVRKAIQPAFQIDEDVERLLPAATGETPEKAYDRVWFHCLLQDSLAELKAELDAEAKSDYFAVFQSFFKVSKEDPDKDATYDDVGARLGLKRSGVMNRLAHCKKALRAIVRRRIRDYVTSPEELEQEFKEALGS